MSDDECESYESEPPYLIRIGSLIRDAGAGLERAHGADYDLLWQVRDSVRDKVSTPVILPVMAGPQNLLDVFTHNDVLIVSDRARAAIEPWLKDYEFIEACIETSANPEVMLAGQGKAVEGYWWLNSWRRIDAIDWEKSDVGLREQSPPGTSFYTDNTPLKASGWRLLALRCELLRDEHFFGFALLKGEARYLSRRLHRHLLRQGLRLQFEAVMMRAGERIYAYDIGKTLN